MKNESENNHEIAEDKKVESNLNYNEVMEPVDFHSEIGKKHENPSKMINKKKIRKLRKKIKFVSEQVVKKERKMPKKKKKVKKERKRMKKKKRT